MAVNRMVPTLQNEAQTLVHEALTSVQASTPSRKVTDSSPGTKQQDTIQDGAHHHDDCSASSLYSMHPAAAPGQEKDNDSRDGRHADELLTVTAREKGLLQAQLCLRCRVLLSGTAFCSMAAGQDAACTLFAELHGHTAAWQDQLYNSRPDSRFATPAKETTRCQWHLPRPSVVHCSIAAIVAWCSTEARQLGNHQRAICQSDLSPTSRSSQQ